MIGAWAIRSKAKTSRMAEQKCDSRFFKPNSDIGSRTTASPLARDSAYWKSLSSMMRNIRKPTDYCVATAYDTDSFCDYLSSYSLDVQLDIRYIRFLFVASLVISVVLCHLLHKGSRLRRNIVSLLAKGGGTSRRVLLRTCWLLPGTQNEDRQLTSSMHRA